MKPTSIIFLIISVVLIIGGMITCTVARNIAETDSYALFSESKGGETYRKEDFSAQDITKIDLVVQNAEIHIIGGAESSYIELYNFRDGLYTLSAAGKIITLDEIFDIKSLFDLSKGVSFSGIRHIFRAEKPTGDPKINIYLNSTAAKSLKVITLDGEDYSLTLENIPSFCDITLNASNSITLTAESLHTSSALTVTAPDCRMTFHDVTLNAVSMKAKNTHLSAQNMYFKSLAVETDDGEIDITAPVLLSDYTINISDGSGRVNIGGLDRPRPYYVLAPSGSSGGTVEFRSSSADFSLKETDPET